MPDYTFNDHEATPHYSALDAESTALPHEACSELQYVGLDTCSPTSNASHSRDTFISGSPLDYQPRTHYTDAIWSQYPLGRWSVGDTAVGGETPSHGSMPRSQPQHAHRRNTAVTYPQGARNAARTLSVDRFAMPAYFKVDSSPDATHNAANGLDSELQNLQVIDLPLNDSIKHPQITKMDSRAASEHSSSSAQQSQRSLDPLPAAYFDTVANLRLIEDDIEQLQDEHEEELETRQRSMLQEKVLIQSDEEFAGTFDAEMLRLTQARDRLSADAIRLKAECEAAHYDLERLRWRGEAMPGQALPEAVISKAPEESIEHWLETVPRSEDRVRLSETAPSRALSQPWQTPYQPDALAIPRAQSLASIAHCAPLHPAQRTGKSGDPPTATARSLLSNHSATASVQAGAKDKGADETHKIDPKASPSYRTSRARTTEPRSSHNFSGSSRA